MAQDTDRRASELSRGVAEEIGVLLIRRRIKAFELAAKVGLSQSAMSRRMVGDQPFDLDELAKIADVLGVTIADLLPASARRFTREFTDKIAFAATPSIPAPRVASTPVPALAGRFASATLATVQPSGPRRTAPTGR